MPEENRPSVTRLLAKWRGGEREALDKLVPLVYDELRGLANRYMRGERPGHTLQATALVNEAFARLVEMDVPWKDRVHFFAVAARQMRRILVDHAKAHRRQKRGGGIPAVTLNEEAVADMGSSSDIVDLDNVLARLEEMDDRKCKLVELVYFGGLTYDEAAEAMDVSTATVHRDLRMARAWIQSQFQSTEV